MLNYQRVSGQFLDFEMEHLYIHYIHIHIHTYTYTNIYIYMHPKMALSRLTIDRYDGIGYNDIAIYI